MEKDQKRHPQENPLLYGGANCAVVIHNVISLNLVLCTAFNLNFKTFQRNYFPDKFQIMFRAGKLSNLEEIREKALSKIILKMQCHIRGLLVQLTFNEKKAEKKSIASIQQNIRNYYNCKNWPW